MADIGRDAFNESARIGAILMTALFQLLETRVRFEALCKLISVLLEDARRILSLSDSP